MAIALTGCANFTVPSFYDDNTSKEIVDLAVAVKAVRCDVNPLTLKRQLLRVDNQMTWLQTYTELKGSDDIKAMLDKMDAGVNQLIEKDKVSETYCKIKTKLMARQAEAIAVAVLRRY